MKKITKFLMIAALSVFSTWMAWGQVSSASPTHGKSYVIAAYVNSKYYALPNGTVNGGIIAGTEISLNSSNKVSSSDASGKTWTLEEGSDSNAGKYYIKYASGSDTYYLYKNGTAKTNYNFAVNKTSKNYWTFTTNGTGYTVTAVDRGENNPVIQYNDSNFRCYSSATPIILLEIDNSSNPSITASNVSINAEATSGSIAYSISNGTTGAKATPQILTGSTIGSLSIGEITSTSVAFTCAANTEATEKYATVRLTYNNATMDVTITQAAYVKTVPGYVIDFEEAASAYTDWIFTNMESKQTGNTSVTAHGGTYYGTTGGKATASIATKATIATPGALTCYVTKQSTNANASSWKIQVSSNGTTWTDVKEQDATTMSAGTWVKFIADLSAYTNVYVRVYYEGSTAVRNIDDLTLDTEPKPVISAENPAQLAYNATAGSISYSISNYVAGTMEATTTADWISNFTYQTAANGEVGFTTTANPSSSAREAKVTLTFTYDTNKTATKEVTITQAGDPNSPGTQNNPYTVSQARAAIDAETGVTGVYATGIVSAIPTAYDSQNSRITFNFVDEKGAETFLQAYRCTGKDIANVVVGATVVVSGNLTKYGSTYEFAQGCQLVSLTLPVVEVEAPTFGLSEGGFAGTQSVSLACATDGATIYYTTDGTAPTNNSSEYTTAIAVSETTTIKAIAYKENSSSEVSVATYYILSNENTLTVGDALGLSTYPANNIFVKGIVSKAPTANPSSGTLTYFISANGQDTNQLQVYKGKGLANAAFTAKDDIQVGDIVTVFGNVKIYNNIKEFDQGNYLVTFKRPVQASITLDSYSVEATADETEGSLALTFEEIDTDEDVDIVWYTDETGTTTTTEPDWIDVDINETTLEYLISANTGEARAAYFKVHGKDAEDNDVYSGLVTVSQAKYVADYATLPFAFDGGRDDIESTSGLTQESLDTDYSSSPKLKFKATGTYMVLKIKERPGVLKFDIKGNSFSDGTFKVQTSTDGTTYTDLKTYTTLGDTQSEEFDNLGADVRYIKWIYTEKVNGNVALGNISLNPYAAEEFALTAAFCDGRYWATFYSSAANYNMTQDVTAYTMDANHHLYQLVVPSEDRPAHMIPAGTAVILIAESSSITLEKNSDPEPEQVMVGDNNILTGSDDAVPAATGTPFVLNIKNGVLGFYPLSQGTDIPANKAYYISE